MKRKKTIHIKLSKNVFYSIIAGLKYDTVHILVSDGLPVGGQLPTYPILSQIIKAYRVLTGCQVKYSKCPGEHIRHVF